jgi:membrane protease YdiL (CAAX protease family)
VIETRNAGRDALISWAAVAVLVFGFVQITTTLPLVGNIGAALVAVLFLYTPVIVGKLRKEDLDDYAFLAEPIGRGLKFAGIAILLVFPIFVVGYIGFYEIACKSDLLSKLVPHGMCVKYGGLSSLHPPKLDAKFFEFCALQLVVVALPEELFFRGFLLGLLEKRFPPKRRILGGGVGLALVLSAAAFAIVHIPKDGDPRALATFFPGLLFGWMRSATSSILAGTVTHAGSNILIKLLELITQR